MNFHDTNIQKNILTDNFFLFFFIFIYKNTMNKQLLVSDIIPIKITPSQLNESKSNNDGRLILKNIILQRANARNQNGRVYPRSILKTQAQIYEQNNVKIRNAIGELDHPDSSTVSLERGALNIIRMWWQGDDLMGDVEILTNLPNGKILEGYLKHEITIGISSRGLGSVVESTHNNSVEVQDDFEIISFDAVSSPSTHRAYLTLNESKQSTKNSIYSAKLNNINNMIDELMFNQK